MAGKPGMHKKAALKQAEKPTAEVKGPEVQENPSLVASQGADIKPQEPIPPRTDDPRDDPRILALFDTWAEEAYAEKVIALKKLDAEIADLEERKKKEEPVSRMLLDVNRRKNNVELSLAQVKKITRARYRLEDKKAVLHLESGAKVILNIAHLI